MSTNDQGATPSAFARALKYGVKSERFTWLELADVAGCSDRHLQNVGKGHAELGHEKVEALCVYMSDHNFTMPSKAFYSQRWASVLRCFGQADGSLDDNAARMVRVMAALCDAHETNDGNAYDAQLQRLRAELSNYEAEGANLNRV